MKQQKIIAILCLLSVCGSAMMGWIISGMDAVTGVISAIFGGLFLYVIGIVSAVICHIDEMTMFEDALAMASDSRRMMTIKWMDEVIRQERQECSDMTVCMAKAVADRVANRILAKYVDGLSDSRKREIVLKDVDDILKEEISAFYDAIKDESEK